MGELPMKCIEAQQMVKGYLEHQLSDRQLEQFLEHVENCPECYDELEIYYTIYRMLKQPENASGTDEYNFKGKLNEDMKSARRYLRVRKTYRLFRYVVISLAEILLIGSLVTGLELRREGDRRRTTLYRVLYGYHLPYGETPETETETESGSAGAGKERETGPEEEIRRAKPEAEIRGAKPEAEIRAAEPEKESRSR